MQIKKGDCIFNSKPFAYILSSKQNDKRCDYCLKSGKLLKCSGCQYVRYCNRSCQKESWSVHKFECENFKRTLPRILPDAVRLLARIIVKLQRGGEEEKEYYDKDLYRKFEDLMSHYDDIKIDSKRREHFFSIFVVLKKFMSNTDLSNVTKILGIYGRMCINSYNILDSDLNTIGIGIYLAPSVLDHSCKANCAAVFEGTTIFIRAIEDISNVDWSNIYISYINTLSTTSVRRAELQNGYYFLCECERCKEPEIFATAAVCPHCNKECNTEEETCRNCDKVIPAEFKQKFNEMTDLTAHHLDDMNLDISRMSVNKQRGIFHPLNIQHIRTVESVFDAAIGLEYWDDAYNLGIELLPGYIYYYGEIHPLTGVLCLKLGKIQLFLSKTKSALEMLRKADKILKITHGEKHSVMKENVQPLLFQALMESQT